MDTINHLERLKNMQKDVLRRAMDRNQEELDCLIHDRRVHLSKANGALASKHLPSLPIEIVAQIIESLYYLEDNIGSDTTVQRLLGDVEMPNDWKALIQRAVPVVFAGNGAADFHDSQVSASMRTNGSLLGPKPQILGPRRVRDSPPLPGSSITTLVTLGGWPKLEDNLAILCQFPWHALFFAGRRYEDLQKRMGAVKSLVQRCGHKLADLDRLDICPFEDTRTYGRDTPCWELLEEPAPSDQAGAVAVVDDPKLRVARLPLQLLPGLRHILSKITDLDIGIPGHALTMSFIEISDFLRPHSDTLVSLKLSDWAREARWTIWCRLLDDDPPITPFPTTGGQHGVVQFPHLKKLNLDSFTDCILLDAFSTLDCPSLSEICFKLGWYQPLDNDQRNSCISTTFLHERFPSVECIAANFGANSKVRSYSGIFRQ